MKERALEKAFKKTYFGDKISLNSDIGEAFKLGYKLAKKQNKTSVDYLLNLIVGEDAEGKPMLVKNVIDDLEIIKYKELFQQETLEEFAKQEAIKQYSEDTFGNLIVRKSIEKGAKWQQEQFGKSEFIQKLRGTLSDAEARRLIFEQFKKNKV